MSVVHFDRCDWCGEIVDYSTLNKYNGHCCAECEKAAMLLDIDNEKNSINGNDFKL